MDKGRSSVVDVDAVRRENALIGYQMAISLWTYQGEGGWTTFNVMLVANSIVIAVIGFAITSERPLLVFTLVLPIVGLLLCGIWFVLMRRQTEYSDYYILCAREIEQKYLSDPVKTVSRGGLFGEGGTVTIEIDGESIQLRMSRWARILRAKTAANLVIVIFAFLYIATILQGVAIIEKL